MLFQPNVPFEMRGFIYCFSRGNNRMLHIFPVPYIGILVCTPRWSFAYLLCDV
uniref:Uncharacterized protein n=1 Tax=Arundo donax TaxID=35708 RepID=A0A0A9E7X4_ARUDO